VTDAPPPPIDGATFRRVLGHYPTGVCVVTAMGTDGPHALVVGSFTSVSLDPPLVAFLPARGSRSWARIQAVGRFRVNVLGAHQLAESRRFAARHPDKFAGYPLRLSAHGSPMVEGVVAWIECEQQAVHEAGDHFIVVGRVLALDVASTAPPLLFLRGDYGGFSPLALVEP